MPSLFLYVLFKQFSQKKTVAFIGIQTRIVRVEGKHADRLTTTAVFSLLGNTVSANLILLRPINRILLTLTFSTNLAMTEGKTLA